MIHSRQKPLNSKIEVKCTGQGSLNLTSVTQSPRMSSPCDLKAACDSVVVSKSQATPEAAVSLTQYIVTGFFPLAHRTGLYNRQMTMWKSIASVTEVELIRLETGLFNKIALPNYDLLFKDARGSIRLMAHLAEPFIDYNIDEQAEIKRNRGILKDFVYRAQKMQSAQSGLSGLFLCLPRPFPENILSLVLEWTNATDPVRRYESHLPKLGIPIDLLEMNWSTQQANPYEVSLVHPSLKIRGA